MLSTISKRKMLPAFSQTPMEWVEDPKSLHPSLAMNVDEDMHYFYKKAEKSFWVVEELLNSLSKDPQDWLKLTSHQQFFIKNVLAFFAVSDFYVNETITEQIKTRVKFLHWHRWEDFKLMIENTHNKVYGLLVETYCPDKKERTEILDAVRFNPAIQQKINWMHKWVGQSNELVHLEQSKRDAIRELYNTYIVEKIRSLEQLGMLTTDMPLDKQNETINKYVPLNIRELGEELMTDKASLALVVLINAIAEGVFFSGSFCAIFWFKRQGLLPGLSHANDLISRDEGLHCMFAIMVYRCKLTHQLPQKLVHEIMREAVEIEQNFICNSLPQDMLGMNASLMGKYIEFVADQQLFNLGYDRIWTKSDQDNPFPWMMDQSHGIRIADFFKIQPNAYGHHASDLTEEEMKPAFDENF